VTNPTSNEHTTESLLTEFLERVGAQDAKGASELFAGEIDWFVPGSDAVPWAGHRTKREHVAEYFQTMWPTFVPGESSASVDKVVVSGDDAVIFSRFGHTVAKNGKRLETAVAIHLTVANGEFVRMHLYEDTLGVHHALSD